MNPRARSDDHRTARELIRLARRELDHIEEQLSWRESELDGIRVSETVGSSPGPSDPTSGQASSRNFIADKIDTARTRLAALVDSTLPAIYAALRLADERRREDDQHRTDQHTGQPAGPADIHTGLSAHRGDRKAPRGRPDLQEALDAQRQRIGRGEGYGRG